MTKTGTGSNDPAIYPLFDRQLILSPRYFCYGRDDDSLKRTLGHGGGGGDMFWDRLGFVQRGGVGGQENGESAPTVLSRACRHIRRAYIAVKENVLVQSTSSSEAPLEVIDYEIRLLRFCLGRLNRESAPWVDDDRNAYKECFLLHYRNLIRFFSGRRHQNGDLSMAHPEEFCTALPAGRADWYMRKAAEFDNKDEQCDYRRVSAYLQHCTNRRVENQQWHFSEMYKQIEPLLQAFEEDCLERSVTEIVVGDVDGSTVTPGKMLRIFSDVD